jgi:hypothetical protein
MKSTMSLQFNRIYLRFTLLSILILGSTSLLLKPEEVVTEIEEVIENKASKEHVLSNSTAASVTAECGLWFAPSSIPNTGIGMYAGRKFNKGDKLAPSGELVIPVVDIRKHHPGDWFFLWDSYFWSGSAAYKDDNSEAVDAASPGFGSAANSFLDLQNVDETVGCFSLAGLHRSRDAGAGAFTPFHDRQSIATQTIQKGQELFVSCKYLCCVDGVCLF